MFKQIRILLVALVLSSGFFMTSPAQACPMCAVANEDAQDDVTLARPRAYMYSILFMLAMPATMFTAFGISFYRLSQKRTAMHEEMLTTGHSDSEGSINPSASAED